MVAFAAVARMEVGKGEDLTTAAAPEEKASPGSKSFPRSGFGCAESWSVCRSSQPILSGLLVELGTRGTWAWAEPRSHLLVKYYPGELSAMGNTSQMPFPVGGSHRAASVEGSGGLQPG